MTDDGNVTKLPIKFKAPMGDDGPTLKLVDRWEPGQCNHRLSYINNNQVNARYLIREGETEVECSLCNTKLDPMFVLRILAHEETNWHRTQERYQDEMKRLKDRSRTKCENCGTMTRISCR